MTRLGTLVVAACAVVIAAGGPPRPPTESGEHAEVVVLLHSPALARAPGARAAIEAEQGAFREELASEVPEAQIGWRFRLVANGFSVTVPESALGRLRSLPGVREVLPTASYAPQATSSAQQIGAPALWGSALDTAGQGVRIGIIDSGIDPSHRYFDPTGYTMPAGFPKGQQRFTNAKLIVARVFAPKSATAPSARLAFSEDDSSHGTHVAGIAAGNADTPTGQGRVSGVAPRAYLGNYKVFVQTNVGLSQNANSPAIVAAIEAAVADGMDVINFSGGEPEIEPSRDIVALALDAAAAAGVVPVVAAGNDYNDFGAGTVSSPANSSGAISVGAVEIGGSPLTRRHAEFSSVGPTTISARLKPDVLAPGVDVLSSVPGGGWAEFSGTSMAAPHVAGAAALLRQRHPDWTVEQIKSALVQSGVDSVVDEDRVADPRFQGGGVVALARADRPLVFANPSSLSLGLLPGTGWTRRLLIPIADAGGGGGAWRVSVRPLQKVRGMSLTPLTTQVLVPEEVTLELRAAGPVRDGDVSGYVELQRGNDVRRIPYWGRRTRQRLARHQVVELRRPGVYTSTTVGRSSLVSRYRYPEAPTGVGVTTTLRGPERVFRVRITKRVANFGVVIVRRGRSSRVEPRVVAGLDENRLTGYAGLPLNHNPYLDEFREGILAAGSLSPTPGEYAVVFDSPTRAGSGTFTFRYWVNDVTPPVLRVRERSVAQGRPLVVSATDPGAGVYPDSIRASIDGSRVQGVLRRAAITFATSALSPGTHRLRLRVSDYQEAKNTENVGPILPNTRTVTVTFRVR